MDLIPQQLVEKLMLCGLTRSESFGISHDIKKWLQSNGTEWTVGHLKLIKQTILSIKANHLEGVSPYVKTRNHRLVGPFRAIQRLLERGDKRALQALMVYSQFTSSTLTQAQERKFVDAVTSDKPDYWFELNAKASDSLRSLLQGLKIYDLDKAYELTDHWSDSKYAPVKGGKTQPESDKVSQLEHFLDSQFYRIIYNASGCLLPEDSAWFDEKALRLSGSTIPKGRGPIGKVSVLQEPGFKARFIANPNRIVQHALTPLGDLLYASLQRLPWDCTFEQSRARDVIQASLKEAKKVYCYDLSNATDQMPFRTQVELIYDLFSQGRWDDTQLGLLTSQLRLFTEVARSEWTFKERTLTWSRGQPLGLYPSFASFALAHGAILLSLMADLGYQLPSRETLSSWKPMFFVVGDDVVILDDRLARAYEQTLADLEVPISKGKSIISDTLAEFVGEVITRDTVFTPVKWRNVSTKSFADFVKIWGYEAIPLLPGHIRDVAYAYAELPEPVGLGLNPKGKPLAERLENFLELYLNTFTPPVKRVDGELQDLGVFFDFADKLSKRLSISPSLLMKVDIHPSLARTEREGEKIQSRLSFAEMLTDRDLSEYVKYLVDKGVLVVGEIRQFDDIEISGCGNAAPDTLFRKLKSMLTT